MAFPYFLLALAGVKLNKAVHRGLPWGDVSLFAPIELSQLRGQQSVWLALMATDRRFEFFLIFFFKVPPLSILYPRALSQMVF